MGPGAGDDGASSALRREPDSDAAIVRMLTKTGHGFFIKV